MKLNKIFNRRNRILLRELVVTDFKLRYQNSALGYLWSLLKPLMLFIILYFVFAKFLRLGDSVPHYPVYLLLGIVLWQFFSEATMDAMLGIVGRGDLIRKINFPKYIIVFSTTISALINMLLNLVVVLVFLAFNHVTLTWRVVFFPLIILEIYIFALACGFLLSAVYVKYRDVSYIWEVVLQGAFYATPILYPVSLVLGFNVIVGKLLMLSPAAQIIQDARYSLVTQQATTVYNLFESPFIIAIPFIIVIIAVVVSSKYFKKNSAHFAEDI